MSQARVGRVMPLVPLMMPTLPGTHDVSPATSSTIVQYLQNYSQKIEQGLNKISTPIKPFLPHIGRFLLIVTFLEDAWRIWIQWSDQLRFMQEYRGCPRVFSHLFLIYNFATMLSCSGLALLRKHTPWACAGLASVIALQSLGYGLLWHLSFMMRNVSLVGGLSLLLADSMSATKKKSFFAGLPTLNETEKSTYFSLLGRCLLICLFVALTFTSGNWSFLRIVYTIFALIACGMVVVGFKAKYSATILVALLCITNILLNQWWTHSPQSAERDFLRYDFFQTLSIIGGFLLLANAGPGEISLDEKKKMF